VNEQQDAVFTADRGTAGTGPFIPITNVSARNRYVGAYFANVLALEEHLHLTLSGRYNRADVDIADKSGLAPALNGSHVFQRFNPGFGLTLNPRKGVTAYASYYSGMRAATPAELTCADPSAPCRLPNAFLADPPLSAVTAQTSEVGFRIGMIPGVRLRGAVYSSTLRNDIQFVAATRAVNAVFFQNVGQTRRQGAELGAEAHAAAFRVSASYAYIDATYRSLFTEPSPNNSSAVDTDGDGVPDSIQVRPGSRIPGIPRHMFKVRIEQSPTQSLVWGVTMISASRQFARGDENNADVSGSVPGYVVWHADARYRFAPGWAVLAKADNVFNRRYATFGGLGSNFFRGPGGTFSAADAAPEQFRTPAAPRALWLALEYRFAQREDR
jgi:iron complex outermembrane receptor protein